MKKRVIVINRPALEKMLAHFEEQTRFDKKESAQSLFRFKVYEG